MKVRVSAPGKSILMGEHAAVYGRPALVAAVDRRLTVTLTEKPQGDVRLRLPQVDVDVTVSWPEIGAYCRDVRDRWRAYSERPGPETFRRLRGDDPAHLVKVALGEAALCLSPGGAEEDGRGIAKTRSFVLELESDIPIGAGFGSSAATSVAVFDACLALHGVSLPLDALHRRTLEVERRQHGQPSGVDNATVLHGGLIQARRSSSGEMKIEALSCPVPGGLRLFNSGSPNETTGEVVAAVRRRLDADPRRYGPVLDRMESTTAAFRRALEEAAPGLSAASPMAADRSPPSSADRLIELIRTFEVCLEDLGVVPGPVRQVIRRIEDRGGAAKISGAGALTGDGAGSVLVYHPQASEIAIWNELRDWTTLDLRLGAEGLRRETVSGPGSDDRNRR